MSRRRDAGFSLIELLVVLVVIGTLVQISVPMLKTMRRHAVAMQAAADLHTLRAGLAAHYAATNSLPPPNLAAATVPPTLVPYVPGRFSMSHPEYQLYWMGGDPLLPAGGNGNVVVVTNDPELLAEIDRVVAPNASSRTIVGAVGVYDLLQTTL